MHRCNNCWRWYNSSCHSCIQCHSHPRSHHVHCNCGGLYACKDEEAKTTVNHRYFVSLSLSPSPTSSQLSFHLTPFIFKIWTLLLVIFEKTLSQLSMSLIFFWFIPCIQIWMAPPHHQTIIMLSLHLMESPLRSLRLTWVLQNMLNCEVLRYGMKTYTSLFILPYLSVCKWNTVRYILFICINLLLLL